MHRVPAGPRTTPRGIMTDQTETAHAVEPTGTADDTGVTTRKTTKKTKKKAAKKRVRKKTATKKAEPAEVDSAPRVEQSTPNTPASVDEPGGQAETTDTDRDAGSASESGTTAAGDIAGDGSGDTAGRGAAGTDTPETEAATKPKRRTKTTKKKKASTVKAAKAEGASGSKPAAARAPECEMVINYSPGEECRIAILEDGQLEEFDSEPTEHVSRVGNIYVGRVANIERNIQAAFVDFGVEEAGFLHVSDLHPRYFPGADLDETERVGHKTPRRQRPPIEKALKRGQEITVQVLKEGVGTKGPTLTSYLSIPGRYLVMMPDMDRVGVSRKVEDEDERRKMRQVLDQLDLPDGFGFILRTAGFDRTKTELKRDLAYLARLWKDMERRRGKSGGPRLLYSEADLLLRTIRDRTGSDIKRIIVDNEAALRRVSAFMKIVSPRATTKLCHYTGNRPIFHAFGIEAQLDLMHATEVPLPSGGRLIIEQTEALVAIDVNSGRSRGAKDAETNAYQTNLEAVDEICRQLRLRDLGGLVINDLIDMRFASHRKEIENRFKERLKRDKARSTILPISQFGILEMTRQRMRGSFEQQHFQTCPRCSGRGLIQRPDSVAAGALRDLAALLEHSRVQRVEMVVSPLVAGALLSTRRDTLGRIERMACKKVDVRVSEAIPSERVKMYAYDANGADIEIERLPKLGSKPEVKEWDKTDLSPATDSWAVDLEEEAEIVRAEMESEARAHEQAVHEKIAHLELPGEDAPTGKKKSRRRRRRKRKDTPQADEQQAEAGSSATDAEAPSDTADAADAAGAATPAASPTASETPANPNGEGDGSSPENGEPTTKKKRRRRRRRKGKSETKNTDGARSETGGESPVVTGDTPAPASEPSRESQQKPEGTGEPAGEVKPKRKRRSLYGAGRRALSASEQAKLGAKE